jgi:hypothetical protein
MKKLRILRLFGIRERFKISVDPTVNFTAVGSGQ